MSLTAKRCPRCGVLWSAAQVRCDGDHCAYDSRSILDAPLDEIETHARDALERWAGEKDPHRVFSQWSHAEWLVRDSRGCTHYIRERLAEMRALRASTLVDPTGPAPASVEPPPHVFAVVSPPHDPSIVVDPSGFRALSLGWGLRDRLQGMPRPDNAFYTGGGIVSFELREPPDSPDPQVVQETIRVLSALLAHREQKRFEDVARFNWTIPTDKDP